MTIPWSVIPKTPKDRLIDILVGMPTILQDIKALKRMPLHRMAARERCRHKILAACWAYDRQLCSWYQTSVPLARLHSLEKSAAGEPLSTEDLSLIYSMTIFSTICVVLYGAMEDLGTADLPERADLLFYVNKIGHYLQFFFHPRAGQYGLEMVSFPLGICLQLLEAKGKYMNVDAEKATFGALIRTDRGREIMEFLLSMMYVESINKD